MQYVVKIDRLGGKAEIRGIGLGDERISRFEITAKDYISASALPLRIKLSSAGEEDRSDLAAKLRELFISESRIKGYQGTYFPIFKALANRLQISPQNSKSISSRKLYRI